MEIIKSAIIFMPAITAQQSFLRFKNHNVALYEVRNLISEYLCIRVWNRMSLHNYFFKHLETLA